MTLSGHIDEETNKQLAKVLIPLLLDDPLRGFCDAHVLLSQPVLIPLLLDDPLRDKGINGSE